jgi:hypothetical protein
LPLPSGTSTAPLPPHRLIEVGDDVRRVFEADRETHHVGAGAGSLQLFRRKLAVGGRCRVDDERSRIADIGEMRDELLFSPKVNTAPAPRGA